MFRAIKKILFLIARSRYSSYFIGFSFKYLSALMPLDKVFENKYVLSFKHPVPFWTIHFLVVPKMQVSSFASLDLSDLQNQDLVIEIFRAVKLVTSQQKLTDFVLLVNGGGYQDVPQIHFHIASGTQIDGSYIYREKFSSPSIEAIIDRLGLAVAYEHSHPTREFHVITTVSQPIPRFSELNFNEQLHRTALFDVLSLCQKLVINQNLSKYTILMNSVSNNLDPKITFHLVSGSKLQDV